MKIIKKINTSAALAIDSAGKEIVVLGKGIGFPPVPYELEDLSKIDRTFYDINPKYLDMIEDIPQQILMISGKIAENAECVLERDLNPNLPFILADHINFALLHKEKQMNIFAPISYDIEHLYPEEYRVAVEGLAIMKESAGIELPESEAFSIAMHIINAGNEHGSIHELNQSLSMINEITEIIERELQIVIDKKSYNYSRFLNHLQYLIQRLKTDTQMESDIGSMYKVLSGEYPDIYQCVLAVSDYFQKEKNYICNKEEKLYLLIHIQRLSEKN